MQLPPPKTDLFTDPRHTMAAERMSADEYFYFSLDNTVENEVHALHSSQEYLANFRSVRGKGRLRSHITF